MADVTLIPIEDNEVRLIPFDEGNPNVRLFTNDRSRSGGMQQVAGIASQSDLETRATADDIKNVLRTAPATVASGAVRGAGSLQVAVAQAKAPGFMPGMGYVDGTGKTIPVADTGDAFTPPDRSYYTKRDAGMEQSGFEKMNTADATMTEIRKDAPVSSPFVDKYLREGFNQAGNMLPTIPLAAIPIIGPELSVQMMAQGAGADAIKKGREIGLTDDEIDDYKNKTIVPEYVGERLSIGPMLAMLNNKVPFFKALGTHQLAEITSEMGTSHWQLAADKAYEKPGLSKDEREKIYNSWLNMDAQRKDPKAMAEWVENMKDTAITTLGMTHVMGAAGGVHRLASKVGNATTDTTDPITRGMEFSGADEAALVRSMPPERAAAYLQKKQQSQATQQDPAGAVISEQPISSPVQNEAYDDTSDMEAPKGVLESATDQAISVQPTSPVQEVTEADKVDFENAVLWENNLRERGRSAVPHVEGETEREYAWRLLSEYRKVITPMVAGDSAAPAVQSDSEQKGVANAAADILPGMQGAGPGQVDGQGVVVPEVQSQVAGVGSDNIQSGGIANDVSQVRQETGEPETLPPVRGEDVVDDVASGNNVDNFEFPEHYSPSDVHSLWDDLYTRHDDIAQTNQPKIQTLQNEREKLKGDKSKEAASRKKAIDEEISGLHTESQIVQVHAERAFEAAQTKLADKALEAAKKEGINVAGREDDIHELVNDLSDGRMNEQGWSKPLIPQIVEALRLDSAAHEAATSPKNDIPIPTQAQIEAGNYKKGHINLHGLDISIENPAGSMRKGVDETGRAWETKLAHHYGYIKGTIGKDKDHIDVFVGTNAHQAKQVYVIDQENTRTGAFDEHKVMVGFDSLPAARAGYLDSYDKTGPDRIINITASSIDDFKQWLNNGNMKKPFADAVGRTPVRDALKKDKAFRKLIKDSGDPHPESPVFASFQSGYLDYKDGLPPDVKHRSSKELVDNYPGHGFNPIDSYMNGYLAAKTGQPHNLRGTETYHLYEGNSPAPVDSPKTSQTRMLKEAVEAFTAEVKSLDDGARLKRLEDLESIANSSGEKLPPMISGMLTVARKIKDAGGIANYDILNDGKKEATAETRSSSAKSKHQQRLEKFMSNAKTEQGKANWKKRIEAQKLKESSVKETVPEPIAKEAIKSADTPASIMDEINSLSLDDISAMLDQVEQEQGGTRTPNKTKKHKQFLQRMMLKTKDGKVKDKVRAQLDKMRKQDARPVYALEAEKEGEINPRAFLIRQLVAIGEPGLLRDENIDKEFGDTFTITVPDSKKEDFIEHVEGYGFTVNDLTSGDGDLTHIQLIYEPERYASMKPQPAKLLEHQKYPFGKYKTHQPDAVTRAVDKINAKNDAIHEQAKADNVAGGKPEKDNGQESFFKEGDRVQTAAGRHGTISKATSYTMKSMLVDFRKNEVTERREHSYDVRWDNGVTGYGSFNEMFPETDPAPAVAMAPFYDGSHVEAGTLLSNIDYSKKSASNALDAARRARKADKIDALKKSAKNYDAKAAAQQAVFDTWAEKYPEAAEFLLPKKKAVPVVPAGETTSTDPAEERQPGTMPGLRVTLNAAKNGIELHFNGKPSEDILSKVKQNGFRWARGSRVWYANDTPVRRKIVEGWSGVAIGETPKVAEYQLKDNEVQPEGTPYIYRKLADQWAYSHKPSNSEPTWINMNPPLDFRDRLETLLAQKSYVEPVVSVVAKSNINVEVDNSPYEKEKRRKAIDAAWSMATKFINNGQGTDEYYNVFKKDLEVYVRDYYAMKPEDLEAAVKDVGGYAGLFDLWSKQTARAQKPAPITKQLEAEDIAHAKEQERSANEIIKAAANEGVKGAEDALKGLHALFGGSSLKSFPGAVDEATYAAARPHFKSALDHFVKAGKGLKEYMEFLFKQFGNGIKPYALRFLSDVKNNAPELQIDDIIKADAEKGVTVYDERSEHTEDDRDSASGQSAPDVSGVENNGETTGVSGEPQGTAGRDGSGNSQSVEGGKKGHGPTGKRAVSDNGEQVSAGTGNSALSGIPGRDYRIPPGGLKREGSWRVTAERNLDIIKLVRQLDEEGRAATPEEQELLSKYTGFGASEIANKLFPGYSQYGKIMENWADKEWRPLVDKLLALNLSPEELKTLAKSTQYAHYTSEAIVRGIYTALEQRGFRGGKILEPGMGSGNFIGAMPDSIYTSSKYTGIEMDHLTASIAKYLYPQQNILQADYTKQKLPHNFFDLAIGNPPFADTPILSDPEYRKNKFSMHDYFFAKTIDRVRPGGLMVFVTSRYTMDKVDDKARAYLAERADLVGAVRLPQTAFLQHSGTEVVTDILFFRKKVEGSNIEGFAWNELKEIQTPEGPAKINEYYADHPEMILGTSSLKGTMYGANQYTVLPREGNIDEQFAAALENLPGYIYSPASKPAEVVKEAVAERDFNPTLKKEGGVYLNKNGVLMRVEQGAGQQLDNLKKLSKRDREWLTDYVPLRDAVKQAKYDQWQDSGWEKSLQKVNKLYQAFIKKHGRLQEFTSIDKTEQDEDGNDVVKSSRRFKNAALFKIDTEGVVVEALEYIDDDGNIKEAAFLKDRTIRKPEPPQIKTLTDALAVSLDQTGVFDLDHISELAKISRNEVIDGLGDMVYETTAGEWQLADEYLSGDVVRKLEEAEQAARMDDKYKRNVEALTKVQPRPLTNSDISVKLGATWLDHGIIEEFADDVLEVPVSLTYTPATGKWRVDNSAPKKRDGWYYGRRGAPKAARPQGLRGAGGEWSTADRGPNELLESILNNQSIKITRTDSDGKTYTDTDATTAANEVAKNMRKRFSAWVWEDAERANILLDEYNKRYNNMAARRFDGSHLTLPGVSLKYKLHPHQLRAIWRVIQTGDTYLAHAVGAGKTIEMIAAGMEMKRLGMIAKPLYVVPNHMLEQFSSEFQDLYPLAIIMVADEENFHTTNRRRFMAQATMNNPDAIVITHSSFGKMGMKPENVAQVRDEILNELREYLYELQDQEGEKAPKTKQMEKRIEKAEQRFDSIAVSERSDQSMTFEDLGVDFVFVDEAHEFRKLDFSTSRQVKGIDPVGSRKALDLYVKTRWLQGRKPGRSIVFASGTPITNTIGELYTVQRFFQHDQMEEDGINHFDAWSAMFGEIEPGFEMNAAGRYEVIERFSKFDNMPELSKRVRTFMDVLTSDQLSAYVKRPEIKGGQAEIVVVPPSAELKDYQQNTLLPRIERSKKWKPSRDERNNPDPIIAIIADGRLASIDMRFMNPALPSDPDSKLNRMIDGIIESYKEGKGIQYKDRETDKPDPIKGGAQIVFYNQGFGAGVVANRGFDSRAWLMKRLKDAKIPASEVAWIDDYDTADKKEAMMKEVRQGNKRILIGSAKKMGTGMNVQKRLLALHYLDPPWYPADVIQPDGRILRQGNQNDVVTLQRYATKGSYDATQWQMVARKAKAIESFLNGDDSVRSIEDLSESNQFAMAAALASGDERVIQLAGLQADVERLISLQNAHAQEQSSLRWQKTNAETGVKWTKNRVADLKVASKAVGGWIRDFTGKVGDTDYNKRDEFGQALLDAYTKIVDDLLENPPKQSGGYDKDIGTINGFKISLQYHVTKNHQTREQIKAKEEAQYTIDGFSMDLAITKDVAGSVARASYGGVEITDTPRGLTDKIINTLNGVDKELKEREQSLQEEQEQMAVINKRLGTPYQYANELAEKIAEATRLQNELTAEGEQVPDAGTLPAIDFVNDGEETEAQFKLTDSPARGIQAAEAQAWVSTLPISKRVNVVQSVENLPTNARAEITKAQVDPARVQAMELKGTIHVITDNVPDMQRVKALVVGHELAHAGQSEKIVDLAVDWFKRTTEKEGEHIRSAHAILEQVAGRYGYDLTNDKEFRKAVQEATAAIAEQVADGTLKPIGLMTRLFMYLKHWLRQNGLISHVSDSELSLAVAEMLRIGEKRLSVGIGESKKPKYFLENGEDPARWSISSTAPESTVKAYKLFRTLKSRPGELFPLFIGKTDAVPVGTWIEAEHIPTKGYAPRPGWHAGLNPSAPHLRSAGKIAPDRVWAEIEMPADVDWQSVADGNKTASKTRGDIQDQVPTGGHYAFNTSKRGSDGKQNPAWAWMIGGAIKIVKILTNKDVADVLTKSGMESEIPFETQNNIEVFNNLDTVTRFSTDSEITAKFALAPEIKENISRISEAATLNNLKGILNPLDYSRFRDATSDHLPHSANTWLADNIGNPFWVKENNPAAAPFYDEAKDREVTRMDNNIRMYGGLMDKEGNRVGWDKVKGLFDWNDKTTAWGKIRQEMYDKLTDKQKAAYDVIRFEGDAYNKVYAKLGDALRNHRIKSAGLDAATFAFYQAAIAEEAKAFDVKLQIAAENMAEAGMTPEDIEGHISEYRAKYKDIEGWVHRDHGEGEYQVRVYQPVTSLDLETDEVQHKGEVTDRIRVGTFAGVELTNQMENIIERLGGSFKQLRNGAIIILMPKGQGQKALKEFNALELLDKEGKPKYNVLVYNHFISSVAAAKKLTAKVKSNYKAAMPRNYRDGYEYNTSWNFSAKLNEEDYQVLKTSDMKLELILRSAIDKAKAKGEVSAAEAKEIKKELVRSTAEILLGRGAGLYQIRRAQYLIEGYDTDNAVKKYEDYVNGTAGLFSKARYALRQFKNMKDAPASIRAWATKYVGDSLRNMGSADMVSGNARAIVSLWYLGFNTSWMLVNSTQPLVVGQAELSKYTSSPAFKIAKAEKDILTSKLTDEEKSLFTDMQVRSQDHDSMMAEMTGSNEGIGGKASKMLHGATKIAMALGQKVEVLNRHTMIVSAYRVFKGEKGMDHATALKQALDVNSMVNIDMGRYNLPAWARGPVGRTFYALQSYIQHMLNYLYNRSTSGNRADQKAVLRLLFAMFLLGGLPAGAPGSDELDKLIQTIFGYSPKLAFKSWMHRFAKDYDTPGEMLEGFVWHGIPGAFKPFGIGVSLTGATQFRLPIISSVIGGDDMYKAVGGPVSGLFTKGKMSIQAAVRGDWGRAVEYILPTAPSNIMSAIRQSTDGVKIAAGKRVEYKGKQLKMEPQEAALKAFGLQPARTADISETRGFEKSTQAEWNDRRKDALDNYRMSRKLKYIQEFNRDLRGSQAQGLVPAISPESLANVWGKTNVKKSAWERAHGVE